MYKVIDNTECEILETFDTYEEAMDYALNFSNAHPTHSLEVKKTGSTIGIFIMDGTIV